MSNQSIYISRQQAETFLAEFAKALNQPSSQPLLFHIHGMGGVGKSTLLKKLQETYQQAHFAKISFGLTADIETPIKLMAKLYEQLKSPTPNLLQRDVRELFPKPDPFTSLYDKYQDTSIQLQTQPVEGNKSPDPEQIKLLKQGLNAGASTLGQLVMPQIAAATLGKAAEMSVDASAAILTEKDRFLQFLQQHPATKEKKDLRELMLEPLPRLTKAFAEGLSQKGQKRPVILVLDTYEKALTDIDLWLCQYLLGNTELKSHPVRIIVAGRSNLLKTEYWRKLQQDWGLVYEQSLKGFDKQQTTDYLRQSSITEPDEVDDIYQATKGLPYYLNWIRGEKVAGRKIDFSQGNEEIVALLLQGLNPTQKQVLQLAACCRWFDRPLIQHLMKHENLDFDTAADDSVNCFEWLKQKQHEFVVLVQKYYRLDDVARHVFRQSLWQEDEAQFRQIHGLLADYFEEKANQEVPSDSLPPDRYNNLEWRTSTAEFLYHALFSRRGDTQRQFISHLFASRYFSQDEVVTIPLTAIAAEEDLTSHPFLKHVTQQFLTTIKPAVEYGWRVLEEDAIDYPFLERAGFSKSQIDQTLETCFSKIDSLEGLAKFAALLYKSRRCRDNERLDWLQKAKEQAEQIATPANPEFSSGLFFWDVGNALYNLGRFEEALASYDKALEFKDDLHEAWYNRGNALSDLGRIEEALASYNKALKFKADFLEAWYSRGNALYNLGRIKEAIASYDKALEFKPDFHQVWNNRGIALYNLGRFEEAIASFDKALEIKPDDDRAVYNKACCYALQGNVDLAIENLQQAIHLNPDEYREMAKTDSDFDSIREDERFQLTLQEPYVSPDRGA